MQIQATSPYRLFADAKKYNNFIYTSNFKNSQYLKDSFEKHNSDISFAGFR